MMTLEEQERRAYANGDVVKARLLTLAVEADEAQAAELEDVQKDLEAEIERAGALSDDLEHMRGENHALEKSLDEAHEREEALAAEVQTLRRHNLELMGFAGA